MEILIHPLFSALTSRKPLFYFLALYGVYIGVYHNHGVSVSVCSSHRSLAISENAHNF